jgi:ribokinase
MAVENIIWVIGSINVDRFYRVKKLPKIGETINAHDMSIHPGGKGFNQAVAAANVNGRVRFSARIGDDDSGMYLLEYLKHVPIETPLVTVDFNHPTGQAIIQVDENGDNMITVLSGANGHMKMEDLPKVLSRTILMQCELPVDLISEMISNKGACRIALNLAPYRQIPLEVLRHVDILVVNEGEARQLLGVEYMEPEEMLNQIKALLPDTLTIITLGERGVLYIDEIIVAVPPCTAQVQDTTGAGDTFVGVLVGMIDEVGIEEAIRWANCAAAMSTERMGAQSAMPTRQQIITRLEQEV